MKDFFQFETDEDVEIYICDLMEQFQTEEFALNDPQIIFWYYAILIHYLKTQRPVPEQNADSIFKLLGATQKSVGYRSPFFAIMAKMARQYPEDEYFEQAEALERKMTVKDINELYEFSEWIVMKEPDEEYRENLLGELTINRLRYTRHNRKRVILKRSRIGSRDLDNEFIKKCEEFVKEYTPQKINAYLDRFIIGQEEAKKNVSIAVYNHYLRILYPEQKLIKSNVIMIGPSGCGKTEIIRRIADLVNVPVIVSDFSGVVATPWKGRNKEEALSNLYTKSGNNLALTERGIVFYDEFDKIIPVRNYMNGGDINNELQGQMLGMMEGTMVEVPYGKDKIQMNTENMLFICAGAFEGLEEIVRKDMPEANRGFGMPFHKNTEVEITEKNIKVEHLISYGMKPELAGRLSVFSVLRGLSRDDYRRILTEPEDSIVKRYQNEFMAEEEVKLEFSDEALDAIIDKVMEMNIGARALNSVLHDVLAEALFAVPTMEGVCEVNITEDVIKNGGMPEYR